MAVRRQPFPLRRISLEHSQPEDEQSEFVQTLVQYASFFHNSIAGRLVLEDLKKVLDRPSYKPGRSTEEMVWREGRRSVYLDIVMAVSAGIEAIESQTGEQTTHAEGVPGDPLE